MGPRSYFIVISTILFVLEELISLLPYASVDCANVFRTIRFEIHAMPAVSIHFKNSVFFRQRHMTWAYITNEDLIGNEEISHKDNHA